LFTLAGVRNGSNGHHGGNGASKSISAPKRRAPRRWINIIVLVAVLGACALLWPRARPLDQQIREANYIHYLGEAKPPDPGVSIFVFVLPRQHPLALMHRPGPVDIATGVETSEIWLNRDIGFSAKTRLAVPPGSELQAQLARLLERAVLVTNYSADISAPPAMDRLGWLRESLGKRE
jgi:hypothetical protein